MTNFKALRKIFLKKDFFPKQAILTVILTSILTVIRRLGASIIISSNSISK